MTLYSWEAGQKSVVVLALYHSLYDMLPTLAFVWRGRLQQFSMLHATAVACINGSMSKVTSSGRISIDTGARANLELVDKFCYSGNMLNVDKDGDSAVETRVQIKWNKFRQLVSLLTNKEISLTTRERLYSNCVWRSMLHGSETWPLRKDNEVALQWAAMRMIR